MTTAYVVLAHTAALIAPTVVLTTEYLAEAQYIVKDFIENSTLAQQVKVSILEVNVPTEVE